MTASLHCFRDCLQTLFEGPGAREDGLPHGGLPALRSLTLCISVDDVADGPVLSGDLCALTALTSL